MDDLDPEARRVLSLAQEARTPSAEDKARVEKRLLLALGAAAVAAPTAVAAKSAVGAGALKGGSGLVALKWWLLGSAFMVVAAVGGYAALSPSEAPTKIVRSSPSTRAQPVPSPALAPQPEPELEQAPAEATVPAGESEPRLPKPRKPARASGDPLATELALLHRAQSAWRTGQAQEADALLREHQRRFPRSALALERDALRVLTLCELGQKPRAERLARQLLARAPSSPVRASIEQSCALR